MSKLDHIDVLAWIALLSMCALFSAAGWHARKEHDAEIRAQVRKEMAR